MLVVFNLKNRLSIKRQIGLLEQLNKKEISTEHEVIVSPILPQFNKKYHFEIATQNIATTGRNVGELSPQHLKYFGIKYSFVGHLERQHKLGENEEALKSKIRNALFNGITPIICIGSTKDIVEELEFLLSDINLSNKKIIVAYEVISSTLNGSQDYTFRDIRDVYTALKFYLAMQKRNNYNFSYSIIFGGGLTENDIESVVDIGFDGLLIGDRVQTINNVARYLEYESV
jgi:triosephosphate isomerase